MWHTWFSDRALSDVPQENTGHDSDNLSADESHNLEHLTYISLNTKSF